MTNDAPIVEDELQAYVDGRLPVARRAAVDAYLAQQFAAARAFRCEIDFPDV